MVNRYAEYPIVKPHSFKIRRVKRSDMPEWLRLRRALWPDEDHTDWKADMLSMLSQPSRWAQFVAEDDGRLIGLIEAHLREYAEGCTTSPVGFIEGWFVEAAYRRKGVGRALAAAAEDWARSKGCTEMASDALIDNLRSYRAHKALGYEEVERVVCFRKPLLSHRKKKTRRLPGR